MVHIRDTETPTVESMLQRLRIWRDRVQDSLFYLPTLGVAAAALGAWATTWLDDRVGDSIQDFPLLLRTTVAGARALLTTAAAATITVAGIVLSVTVVAVQLAASQFSPRVVATVFGSRFQQTVIAIVTGTFTYDLLILSTVHDGDVVVPGATRTISLTVALVLSIVSVMAIIAFIDRSIEVMKVGEIIRRISEDTVAAIGATLDDPHPPVGASEEVGLPEGHAFVVRSTADGWVQAIDVHGLVSTLPPGSLARMDTGIGSFVGVGTALLTTWPSGKGEDPADVFDDAALRRAFSIGASRRARTDPTFGIRQLVDIALRALSPGINDPTTATEVILHLTEILREALTRDLPPRSIHGEDGQRVYRPHDWSRRDWVRNAFGEIRNASANQPSVAHTLIASMGSLLEHLELLGVEGRADAIRTEAALVLAGLEASEQILEEDIEPIRALAEKLGLVIEAADDESQTGE